MKKHNTFKFILVPLLAAMAFVGTLIQIPLPTGGMIHLGNFIVMLSALILGGPLGGLAGGIGCGLFDLLIYNDPIGMVAYFILKFIMGMVIGLTFGKCIKHKNVKYEIIFSIISLVILLFTTFVLIGYKKNWYQISSKIELKDVYIWIVCSLGYLFTVLLVLAAIFVHKLKGVQKAVLLSSSLAVIINVFAEMVYKVLLYTLRDSLKIDGAIIKSFASIPACILTGVLTVIIVSIIFPLIYNGIKGIFKLQVDGDICE